MELYYAIVNIIDYYSKNGYRPLEPKTVKLLNYLANKENIAIDDVGSANDCPNCRTWDDVAKGFAELYKTGNRV